MKKNKTIISMCFVLIFIFSSQAFAATTYWIGNGVEDLSIDDNHLIFVDVSANRFSIGDTTPDYLFDVEGTGNIAYFYSTNGIGVYAQGSTHGIYSLSSGSTARAAYGYNAGSSGSAVYGLGTSTSFSGYFTGGKGLYYNGGRVFNYASCAIESTANSNTETCTSGKEAVGGGCDCSCGAYRTMDNRPTGSLSAPNGWYCYCADCTSGRADRVYAVCCGGS